MTRDPETITAEIERSRDALASSLDQLAERADPRRAVDAGRAQASAVLARPAVRWSLIAASAVLGLAVLRALFR